MITTEQLMKPCGCRSAGEWHRFSEEKPKEREPVWCADDEGVVGFYYYLPSNSFFETFTHWQSAVKPPPPSKPPPKPAVRESKRGFISAPAIEELKEACKPKPMEWHSSSSKPAVEVALEKALREESVTKTWNIYNFSNGFRAGYQAREESK